MVLKPEDFEGVQILKRSQHSGELVDADFSLVVLGKKKYVYYRGDLLGPVSGAGGSVHVEGDYPHPTVIPFDYLGRQGFYADGNRSKLYTEVGKFRSIGGQLVCTARRGDKWFFVIDGKDHGPFDELNLARTKIADCGNGDELLFWAKTDGQESIHTARGPIATFDEIGIISVREGHLYFKIKKGDQVSYWVDGEIHRTVVGWDLGIPGWSPKGTIYYILKSRSRDTECLVFGDKTSGMYDEIRDVYFPDPDFEPAADYPMMIVKTKGKQKAIIDGWETPLHERIDGIRREGKHLVVVAHDGLVRGGYPEERVVGQGSTFFCYRDRQLLCALPGVKRYSFEDGKLLLTTLGTSSIAL